MPFEHPNTSDNRLQSYAMLIHTPHFDLRLWIGLLYLFHLLWQFSLKCFLLFRICLVVTRTGVMGGEFKLLEVIPPALGMGLWPCRFPNAVANFWPAPHSAIGGTLLRHFRYVILWTAAGK